MPDKTRVLAALLDDVRAELAQLERITGMALDEATSPESKAENKYDTRSLEASYLAAGQGQRLLAVKRLVAYLETAVGVPSPGRAGLLDLVEVEADAGTSWFLLAPDGGGRRVRVDGTDVVVVTPESPVGGALFGARAGDVVALPRAGRVADLEVVSVS